MPKILVENTDREKAVKMLDKDTDITCIIHPSTSDPNDGIVISGRYSEDKDAIGSWKFSLSSLDKIIGEDLSSKNWAERQAYIENNLTKFLTAMSNDPNLKDQPQDKELNKALVKAKASQYKVKSSLFPPASQQAPLPPHSVIYYAKNYIDEFGVKLNQKLNVTGLGETQQLLSITNMTSGYMLEIGPKHGEVGVKKEVKLDEKTAQEYAEDRIKKTKTFLIDNSYLSRETVENVKGSYIEKLSYLPKEIQRDVLSRKPVDQVNKMARTADELTDKLKNSLDPTDSDRYKALSSVIQERLRAKVEYKR